MLLSLIFCCSTTQRLELLVTLYFLLQPLFCSLQTFLLKDPESALTNR